MPVPRTLITVCVTTALAATLTACTTTPNPTPTPAPTPTGAGEAWHDFHGGHEITSDVEAVWDEEAMAAAVTAATDTMTAYLAYEGATRDEWWAGLAPHLDAIATRDYAWVEPSTIPASHLTGPVMVTAGATPTLAKVTAPTDVGDYTLTLSRRDGAAPWEAGRITPPEGVR